MNRSILLVALLGLMAAPLSQAEEPSVCTSMCTSEKEQCSVRASKLTELDKQPKLEEKNPFAMTAVRAGQGWSESARVTDRLAAQRRTNERVGACNASFKRCTSACTPTAVTDADQNLPAK